METVSEIKMQANADLVKKVEDLKILNQKMSKIKKEKDELSNEIKEYLGNNTELIFEDRLLATYYVNSKPTESIDKELLKTEYPEIYEKVKIKTYNRLLLIK